MGDSRDSKAKPPAFLCENCMSIIPVITYFWKLVSRMEADPDRVRCTKALGTCPTTPEA
jgi:hypothetical protein